MSDPGDEEDEAPAEGDAGDDDDDDEADEPGCGSDEEGDDAPEHHLGETGTQTLVVPAPEPDAMSRWPRGCIAMKRGGQVKLWIYDPTLEGAARLTELPPSRIDEYYDHFERTPRITDASTWGPVTSLSLPVASLRQAEDGRRELTWSAAGPDRVEWTFDVYNLEAAHWRPYLERYLMVLPIQFLRATHFRTIYLDFRVGTARIGRTGRGNPPAVQSGGTNWWLGVPQRPARRRRGRASDEPERPRGPDPAHISAVCVTFSALNRAWWHHNTRGTPTLSDAEIEQAFAGWGRQPFTVYHEFGHVYHFSAGRTGTDDHESQPHYLEERPFMQRVITSGRMRVDGLWDGYRVAIGYDQGGGRTQGPGEGFAEAFRKRLEGQAAGGSAEVEGVLDEFMPTLDSVRRVREAVAAHVGDGGGAGLAGGGEAPVPGV